MALSGVFTGATLPYSTANLPGHTGDTASLRRAVDNAIEPFTEAELRDGTALAWVGAGDAYWVTFFGQNGAFDLTQATAGSQTQAVSSGAWIVTQNGLPGVRFDGTGSYAAADGNYGLTDALYCINVIETDNSAVNMWLFSHNVGTGNQRSWILRNFNGDILSLASSDGTDANTNRGTFGSFTHSALYIREDQIDMSEATASDTVKVWIDGSVKTQTVFTGTQSSTTLHNSTSPIRLGGNGISQLYLGDWFLSVAFPDNKVADRADIYEWVRSKFFDTALTAQNIATGAPTLSSPTLTEDGTNDALTSTDVATGAPTLSSPTLQQEQALTSTDIATQAPTLSSPTLTQQANEVLTSTDIATGAPTLSQPTLTQALPPPPPPTPARWPELNDPTIPYRIHLGRYQFGDNLIRNGELTTNADEWELSTTKVFQKDPYHNGLNYLTGGPVGDSVRQNGLFVEGNWYRISFYARNANGTAGKVALRVGPYGCRSSQYNAAPASNYKGDLITIDRICLKNDYIELKFATAETSITDISAYELRWNDAIDEIPEEMNALKYTVQSDESLYGRYVEGMEGMTFRNDGYTTLKAYKTQLGGEGSIPIMITRKNESNNEWRSIYEGEIVMGQVTEGYVTDIQESYRYMKCEIVDTSAEALIMANRGTEIDLYGYDNPDFFGLPQIWSLLDITGGPNYIEGYTVYDIFDYAVCYITEARARFDSISFSIKTPELLAEVFGANTILEAGIFPADPTTGDYRGFTTTFQKLFDQLHSVFALRLKFMRSSRVPIVKIEVAEFDWIMQQAPTAGLNPTVWKVIEQGREFNEAYALDLLKVVKYSRPKVYANPFIEIPNRYYVVSDMYAREMDVESEFVYDPTTDLGYGGSDLVLYTMRYQERIPTSANDPKFNKAYDLATPNVFGSDAAAMVMLRYEFRDGYVIRTLDATAVPPTEVTVNTGKEELITEVSFETVEMTPQDVEEVVGRVGWNNLVRDCTFRAADTANNVGWWDADTSWVAFQGLASGVYQDSQPNIISQQLDGLIEGATYYVELMVDFCDLFNSNFELIWVDVTGAKEATILDFTTIATASSDYELAGTFYADTVCPADATGIGVRIFSTGSGAKMDLILSRLSLHLKYDATVLDKLIRFDGFRYGRIHNMEMDIMSGQTELTLRAKSQY